MTNQVLWRLKNVQDGMLSSLDSLCGKAGGEMTTAPEPGGGHTAVCTLMSESAVDGAGAATSLGVTAERIVEIAKDELVYFENGSRKEDEEPHYKRVGEYWASIGIGYDGRSKIPDSDGGTYNPAWSAAFISFVMAETGAGLAFPGAAAHAVYFNELADASGSAPLFIAARPEDAPLRPGDIVHFGRGSAKRYDFAEARAVYTADARYPSHSDIVVAVEDGKATTVGGNVSNSVKSKSVKLNADGTLAPRRESGIDYPWIGVLRLNA